MHLRRVWDTSCFRPCSHNRLYATGAVQCWSRCPRLELLWVRLWARHLRRPFADDRQAVTEISDGSTKDGLKFLVRRPINPRALRTDLGHASSSDGTAVEK